MFFLQLLLVVMMMAVFVMLVVVVLAVRKKGNIASRHVEPAGNREQGTEGSKRVRGQAGSEAESSWDAQGVKAAVQNLLALVSDGVSTLLRQTREHNTAIEGHEASIRTGLDSKEVSQLGNRLLEELSSLRRSNEVWRKQLSRARGQIASQQEMLKKLRSEANTDSLTEIANRRKFDSRLSEEIARAERYRSAFSLVFMDIDHFKAVNDAYGHVVGDKVLRTLGHVISKEIRRTDFLARYGGEEFAIILPETNARHAVVVAQKVRRKVQDSKVWSEGRQINCTLSGGVTEFVPGQDSLEILVDRADKALYEAKQSGRNQVVLIGPS